MTHTEVHWLQRDEFDGPIEVVVHGHWGRPVIVFASEAGSPHDFARNGLLESIRPLVDGGELKIFCVSSYDDRSWSASWLSTEDRAHAHRRYEDWIVWRVTPFVTEHCGGRNDIATFGTSMGAFHAVLFALRHPHLFPRALAFSGNYDPWSWRGWGDPGPEAFATNPIQFLGSVAEGHLNYLRSQLYLTLVVGSGPWEDTTGANSSTRHLAHLLGLAGLPHEMHVWGSEWPHDWPSWRAQAQVYFPHLR